MSLIINPRIVSDGLVLALDAEDPRSYPRTGATWYDRSGLGNNVPLSGGPTYNNGSALNLNSSYILFDGSNDYASIYAPNLTTVATIDLWARFNFAGSVYIPFSWNFYSVMNHGGLNAIGFNTGNSDLYGCSNASLNGVWKHYVFEMRSDVSYTNNKIYINGISQSLSQIAGTEGVGFRTFNSGIGELGRYNGNDGSWATLYAGSFRIYNRILSPAEILQNYNAGRIRYNL
jgi:hypothetical protein